MKVRVSYIVEADDELRQAISDHYGRPKKATRKEVQTWYEAHGHSQDLDIMYDFSENDA